MKCEVKSYFCCLSISIHKKKTTKLWSCEIALNSIDFYFFAKEYLCMYFVSQSTHFNFVSIICEMHLISAIRIRTESLIVNIYVNSDAKLFFLRLYLRGEERQKNAKKERKTKPFTTYQSNQFQLFMTNGFGELNCYASIISCHCQ